MSYARAADPLLANARSIAIKARDASIPQEADDGSALTVSKKPDDTPFLQERLPFTSVIFTPVCFLSFLYIIGVAFVVIGAVSVYTSSTVVEISTRYDNICPLGSSCQIPIDITQDMTGPVYMYYKLTTFYQNYRLYVKSRSDLQLEGQATTASALNTACYPRDTSGNLTVYPCGYIAGSIFSDRFTACVASGYSGNSNAPCTSTTLTKDGIAWPSDMSAKFIPPTAAVIQDNPVYSNTYTSSLNSAVPMFSQTVVDEDLAVWMRTAAQPNFKKLHRIINSNLKAGDRIVFTTTPSFDTASIGSSKYIVLSTMSYLGGKHNFMAIAFIVVGLVAIVEGLVFTILYCGRQRKLGDLSLLPNIQA